MKMIIDIPDNELKVPLRNIHLLISNGIVGEVCIKKYDKDEPYFMNLNYAPLEECDDAISREAVLNCLTASGLKKFDFILDARDKIKNLPPVTPAEKQEPCEDVISREAVLNEIYNTDGISNIYFCLADKINALPPVKPAEKVGHWIQTNEFFINQDGQFIYKFICSECKSLSYFRKSNKKAIGANVCPNCGAKMQEVEE